MNSTRIFSLTTLLLALALAPACSSDDGDSSAPDTSAADAAGGSDATAGSDAGDQDGAGSDTQATADTGPAKTNTLLADGDYFVGIKLSLAGAQLRMKVALTAEGEAGKGGKILTFDLYGLGAADDWVSDAPIASAKDVTVKADGTFSVDLGKVTVPAKSSPTGTPVESNMVVHGTVDSATNSFCGDFSGDIPAFQANLKGTTFKAVPFGKEADPYEVGCKVDKVVYEPIKTCPTLKAGANLIKSAGFDRNVLMVLPDGATATDAKLPVVVVYHGNTGNAAGILASTGWATLHAKETKTPFILIAPDTTALVDGKKPVLDWRYGEKAFDLDNRELVLFDDLLKCVGEQFSVDSKRVYVTGMSAGGMMTTFVTAHRGAKVAASSPFSGGYLHTWPKDATKVPMLVNWGGENDFAYKQNFHTLALNLMKSLDAASWWYASCNHGTGHKIPLDLVKHTWTFLQAHTLGGAPAFDKGLPSDFPSYCSLPTK